MDKMLWFIMIRSRLVDLALHFIIDKSSLIGISFFLKQLQVAGKIKNDK